MQNIYKFTGLFSLVLIFGLILYLNEPVEAPKTPPKSMGSQKAPRPKELDFTGFDTNKRVEPAQNHSSEPQATPLKSAWEIRHEEGLAELRDLATMLRGLDPDSEEHIDLEIEISEKMEEMGLVEFHHNGWGTRTYPPEISNLLDMVRGLDDEVKNQFQSDINRLQELAALREEIENEREQNRTSGSDDSAELKQKYHELVAEEFRIQREIQPLYQELDRRDFDYEEEDEYGMQ